MSTGSGAGGSTKTDLYSLHDYVENTLIVQPKEIIIEFLREYFSQDSYYHYVKDPWGYPKNVDHTNLSPKAGLQDDVTTRLYIGEYFHQDGIYYPSLLVKHGGQRYVPLSFNRNKYVLHYSDTVFQDGYGNTKVTQTPDYFQQAGAWEGQVQIEVQTRGPRSRDELVGIISLMFIDTRFEELKDVGLVVKSLSTSGPSEGEDRNDKLFKETVTLEVRTEWKRHIPVNNLIEVLNICVDFGYLSSNPPRLAPNISIQTQLDLADEA